MFLDNVQVNRMKLADMSEDNPTLNLYRDMMIESCRPCFEGSDYVEDIEWVGLGLGCLRFLTKAGLADTGCCVIVHNDINANEDVLCFC